MTGSHEILTRRRALASFGVLAGLASIGCASSNAAALDKATGRPLWRANFDTQTYSSIAGEGDRVYVHVDLLAGAVTEGTAISALAARSGQKLCKDTFPSQSIGGTITAAGGRLYAGFQEGILRALSPATGAVLWRRTTLGEVTSITTGQRVIYASASGPRGGTIYAIWQ